MKIAFLITCYNRIQTTLKCLNSLNESIHNFENDTCQIDIYLVDDASLDQTGKIVKKNFPKVNIIQGTGDLYWSGGMRLAWQKAVSEKEYDFYFWLNDDVILFEDALQNMLADLNVAKNSIIIGVFQSSDMKTPTLTYGGRDKNHNLIAPNGKLQKNVRYIEGNLVSIPKAVFDQLYFIDKRFTHTIGDSDYGIRARKAGISIYISPQTVGVCDVNPIEDWRNMNSSLTKRLKSFKTSKNFILRERIIFAYRDKGFKGILRLLVGTFMRLFFPYLINFRKI